jgi:hypothetical protein
MSAPYSWIKGDLYYMRPDMIIHRYAREDEMFKIPKEIHDEQCRGHFVD